MLVRLRRDAANIALPAAQAAIVVFVVGVDSRIGSIVGLAMLMATGVAGWYRSLRHARLILDTPTSRIASAAQGYTELQGRGRPLDGPPLLSPVNRLAGTVVSAHDPAKAVRREMARAVDVGKRCLFPARRQKRHRSG